MRAVIDPIKMLKLQAFVCTEETRYYLHGVYVEPDPDGGVRMVAADGHCMGLFVDRDGRCEGSGLVSLGEPFIDAIREAVDDIRTDQVLVIDGEPDGLSIALLVGRGGLLSIEDVMANDLATLLPICLWAQGDVLLSGDFPDHRRLLPTQPPEFTDARPEFNAHLLARFGCVVGECSAGIRVHPVNEHDPAYVEVRDEPDFVGVIMPMRALSRRPDSLFNKIIGAQAAREAGS